MAAILILTSFLLVAQTNQGSLAGNVVDASGAVVAGANIVANNQGTGARHETIS